MAQTVREDRDRSGYLDVRTYVQFERREARFEGARNVVFLAGVLQGQLLKDHPLS